jgi:hypothetical protein
MRIIKTIDVGNMPIHEVEDLMEETICRMKNIPYVKKSKFKRFIHNLIDTLGFI